MTMDYDMSINFSDIPKGKILLGAGSVGVGVYLGLCDAKGITIDPEYVRGILLASPTVVRGVVQTIQGGLVGKILKEEGDYERASGISEGLASMLPRLTDGDVTPAKGAVVGGTAGAFTGALQTVIGYTVGYVLASMTNYC